MSSLKDDDDYKEEFKTELENVNKIFCKKRSYADYINSYIFELFEQHEFIHNEENFEIFVILVDICKKTQELNNYVYIEDLKDRGSLLHLVTHHGYVEAMIYLLNCGIDPKKRMHGSSKTAYDIAKDIAKTDPSLGNRLKKLLEHFMK